MCQFKWGEEMNININRKSGVPIYIQVKNQIMKEIKSGDLKIGSKMPTERELAEKLGTSRNTISAAYNLLEQEEILTSYQGRGPSMEREEKLFRYMGRKYPLSVNWDIFSYEDLVLNTDQVRKWCAEGCCNYNNNGGCPPFSPTAEKLLGDRKFILLMSKVRVKDLPKGTAVEIGNFADDLLCSFMIKLGYRVQEEIGTEFLNPGRCRGCDVCTIASGCKNLEKMAYCITGTGIMLGDVIENLFGEKLQWFTGSSEPEYIIKIMAFMQDGKLDGLKSSIHDFVGNL